MQLFLFLSLSFLVSACSNFSNEEKQAEVQPIIQFSADHFGFDTLQIGDTLRHEFIFKNTGTAKLNIDTVSTSCDCASGYFSSEPINPGEANKIEVSFVPRESGHATRHYIVKANTDSVFHVLTLEGYVK